MLPSVVTAKSTPAAGDTPDISVYEDGVRRLNQGDVEGAAIQFRNALQADQNNLPARIALGKANLRLGNAAGAVKELRIALALGAARDQVYPLLGNALLAQRKYADILEFIKPADPASDGGFEVLLLRARAHYELGQLAQAETGYRKAMEVAPKRPEPLTGLAQIVFADGRVQEALAHVDRALEIAPTDVEAWYRKAEFLRAVPDVEGALAAYAKALTRYPRSLRVRLARAALLLDAGRLQQALDDVLFVRERNADDISATFLLWQIHERMRNPNAAKEALDATTGRLAEFREDAILKEPILLRIAAMVSFAKRDLVRTEKYLETYVGLRPNDRAMRRLRGRVQLLIGDAKSAIESLYPLWKQNPGDLEIMLGLGQAYLQNGRYAEAVAVLEEAHRLVPADQGIISRLALGRVGLGAATDAMNGLADALERHDAGSDIALLLALLQHRNGDRDAALATVESVARQRPEDPRTQNLLGVLLAADARIEPARVAFQKANVLEPDYVPPVFNLARLDVSAGNIAAATSRLERIVERNPRSDAALMALADVMLVAGDREAALKWLDKAAAAAPDAINTRVRLVEMRLSMGQEEEALREARNLVDRNPENAHAVEALAKVQASVGQLDQAQRNLRAAVRYAGYDAVLLMRIARQQVELADFAEARKTLLKATNSGAAMDAETALVRLDTRVRDYEAAQAGISALRESSDRRHIADILQGELHLQRKEHAAALTAFENAQLAQPTAEGALGIASVHLAQGRHEDAARVLEDWRQAHPDDTPVVRMLALTYLPLRRLDAARALHEGLLAANPDDPLLLANLARLYQLDGDPRARATAERAHRLASSWAVALDTLGWILVTEGQAADGLKLLREALARDNNPLTRYHLAQALNELGRPDEARLELEAIIAGGKPGDLVEDARRYLAGITDNG